MDSTIKRPKRGKTLEKFKKLLQVVALIVGVTFPLMRGIQELLKEVFPDKRHEIAVIILCATVSFAIAVITGLFKGKIFRYFGRFMPRLKALVRRIHLPRWTYICLYTVFIVLVIYLVAFRTDAWYVVRSWYRGPLIDLTSTSRKQTFQPGI